MILGEALNKKLRIITLLPLLIYLYGCEVDKTIPTATLSMNTTPTNSPRWIIYENALSKAILRSEGGLCEWKIYGTSNSNKEVYVWALCQFKGVDSRAGSVPAVIYLDDSGSVSKVSIPRDGTYYVEDIHIMFPPEIAVKMLAHDFDAVGAMKNIDVRRKSPALPLIVASGTPMP
jgi:hypothetical protein